jgi:hypothetical protein
LSGNVFSLDLSRYESSQHKFRSQFNDNEWREHQARSEQYFRSRHPEYYLNRQDRYRYHDNRDYYDNDDSRIYNFPYGHGYRHGCGGNDWNVYDDKCQNNDDYNYDGNNYETDSWDENEDYPETWEESD